MELGNRVKLINEYTGNRLDYKSSHPSMKFISYITHSVEEQHLTHHNVVQLLRLLYCSTTTNWQRFTQRTIDEGIVKNPSVTKQVTDKKLLRIKWKKLYDDYLRHMIPIALVNVEEDQFVQFHRYFHRCYPDFLHLLYQETDDCRARAHSKVTDPLFLLPVAMELYDDLALLVKLTQEPKDLVKKVTEMVITTLEDIAIFNDGRCIDHQLDTCSTCSKLLDNIRENIVNIHHSMDTES